MLVSWRVTSQILTDQRDDDDAPDDDGDGNDDDEATATGDLTGGIVWLNPSLALVYLPKRTVCDL